MTAPAKAAPMREDVTPGDRIEAERLHAKYAQLLRTCGRQDVISLFAETLAFHRLAHTARPDARDDQREHVMPGDPADIMQIALQWYLNFNFAFPHSVRESNIAVEGFKDGYRAALSRPDAGDEDVERVARAITAEDLARVTERDLWSKNATIAHRAASPLIVEVARGQSLERARINLAALAAMREGVDRGMVERAKEIEEAAREYFDHYLQDEADSEADCVCGAKQHLAAVRLRDALEQPR